jgi:hypothetical protein
METKAVTGQVATAGAAGPRAAGRTVTLAAVALFGLSSLTATSSPNDTIVWFILLGLGLSPVMVGATDVIVGNAPVELAGVAGGLQSTAMQIGGTLGTAVLGAVMSARISSLLPASWQAAHLPALTGAQQAAAQSAISVGAAPVTSSTPPQIARVITDISRVTFASGMHTAFLLPGGGRGRAGRRADRPAHPPRPRRHRRRPCRALTWRPDCVTLYPP